MNGFSENKLIYTGNNKDYSEEKLPDLINFPDPPPWRDYGRKFNDSDYFSDELPHVAHRPFTVYGDMVDAVNMAIYLRRPLLVTGDPGVGKTSLAYDIAYELQLGPVLEWPITSRSTRQDGLYHYDAMGRLHAAAIRKTPQQPHGNDSSQEKLEYLDLDIGDFITLGPLGTALLPRIRPRLLLIDEFDKSDYDLPNDLLYIFETGEFEIPELKRIKGHADGIEIRTHNSDKKYKVKNGKICCAGFPLVVITSNEERELPAPFLRRCVRLHIGRPQKAQLTEIVEKHIKSLTDEDNEPVEKLIDFFDNAVKTKKISNDQLLSAVYLMSKYMDLGVDIEFLKENILKPLE